MFNSFSSQKNNVDKKRLARNPFKPPTPVKRQGSSSSQQTLNFFSKGPSKSLGLSPVQKLKKVPLKDNTISILNEQDPNINVSSINKSSSFLSASKSNSFEDVVTDDDLEITEVINLKNSKPVGTLLKGLKPKEHKEPPIASTSRSYTTISSISNQSSLSKRVNSEGSKSESKYFKPTVTLGSLNKRQNGQTTLNFGSKDPSAKKRINPWESTPLISKKIKNPRIKDEPSRVQNHYQSSLMLSEEQKKVLKLVVEEKTSVFYTGSAGTGKSVLLKELVQALVRIHGINAVAVTASTGLAAVNIGGQTINRFSGIGIGLDSKEKLAQMVKKRQEAKERWKRTKVLIIDEISMLDGRFLDKLEYVARQIRDPSKNFGGVQLVLTGDFFQLPPVDKKDKYGSPNFCFESECWKRCIQKTILLKQVFRQADGEFVKLLNQVRIAEVTDTIAEEFKKLSRDVNYEDGIQPTELFSTRYEVDRSNSARLSGLPGKTRLFEASDSGPENMRYLLEGTMAPVKLHLKEDAQVMMLKNIDETLVNGSVGRVLTFLSEGIFLKIKSTLIREYEMSESRSVQQMRMLSKCYGESSVPQEVLSFAYGKSDEFLKLSKDVLTDPSPIYPIVGFSCNGVTRVVCVKPEEFKIGNDADNESNKLSRTQIPLLLSWALSIHKSQGQTLDRVKVDLTRVFEAGQVYVALSRAVSKERLQVVNFAKHKISTNPKVKELYKTLEHL